MQQLEMDNFLMDYRNSISDFLHPFDKLEG